MRDKSKASMGLFWNDSYRAELKYLEESCPSASFSPQITHGIGLGVTPRFCDDSHSTKRLWLEFRSVV
jgi:hypothetical protein